MVMEEKAAAVDTGAGVLRRELVKGFESWFGEPVAVQLREPWAQILAAKDPATMSYLEITNDKGERRGAPVGTTDAVPVLCGLLRASPCGARLEMDISLEGVLMTVLLAPENVSFISLIRETPRRSSSVII
jgi:hypothetical protein